MTIKVGNLRGEIDGSACCVWYPLGDDDSVGMCFDFEAGDIDDFIALLRAMKEANGTQS